MTTKVKLIAAGVITPSELTLTTASAGTNTVTPATTAFVQQELTSGLAPKSTIASPTFTGTPSAPTAAGSTTTTQLATTAFVQQELTTLIGGAPSTLNDLNELAAAINDDANYNSTLTTALATKLPLAGGTVTGNTTFNTLVGVNKAVNSLVGLSVGADANSATSYGLEVCNSNSNTRFLVDGLGSQRFYGSDSSETARFTDGKLGIGTNDPTEALDVEGSLVLNVASAALGEEGIFFRRGFSNSNKYNVSILNYAHDGAGNFSDGISINGYDGVSICTGSNTRQERMRIVGGTGTSSGNVGIGTTDPGASKLKVYNSTITGNTQLHIHNDKTGDAAVLKLEGKRTSLNDTGQLIYANNGNNVAKIDARSGGDDGALRFFVSASGTGTNMTQKMALQSDGQLLLGQLASDVGVATNIVEANGNFRLQGGNRGIKFNNGAHEIVGIEQIANHKISLASSKVTIDVGNSRVGIGTSAPQETLVVSGNTDVTGQMYLGDNDGDRRPFAKSSNWGYSSGYKAIVLGSTSGTYSAAISGSTTLSFNYDPSGNSNGSFSGDGREILFRNGTQFVTPNSANNAFNLSNLVLSNGKVGIGTTTPDALLDIEHVGQINKDTVEGLLRLTGHSNTENGAGQPSAGVGVEFYNSWSNGVPYSIGRISARGEQSYNGGLQFDVTDNTAPGQNNFATAMYIDPERNLKSYGKIEVGTFPQSQTNSGEAWIGRANDRQDGTLTVQLGGNDHTGTNFEIVDRAWSKVMYRFSGEAPSDSIWTGSNGNTQFGYHVYNSSSGISMIGPSGRTFWDMNYNSAGAEILLVNNRAANGTVSLLQYRTNGVVEGSIIGNGTGLAISNVSDYRKKENIRNLTGSLNIIKSLQPRIYEYREGFGTEGDHIGFIAHEIQAHIPKAVTGNKDDLYTQTDIDEGATEITIGSPKYQAVSYTHNEIITRLVQSIQEQQTIIDDLKARIESLEG